MNPLHTWLRGHPGVRRAMRPLLDRAITAAERAKGFRTMPGSYLPYRVAILRDAYEAPETRFLTQRAASARLILDIGANVGYFAAKMARVAPRDATICALEPNPLLTAMLVANLAPHPQARVFPLGLSDRPGPMTLHMAGGEYATASVQAAWPQANADGAPLIALPCLFTTGQLFLESLGLGVPDLIKIDVEGWEHAALSGFGLALREGRIGAILFEFNPRAQSAAGQEPLAVADLLRGAGYSISRLTEEGGLRELSGAALAELPAAVGEGGFASLVATRPSA
jgi:FkbM family methyltransferase